MKTKEMIALAILTITTTGAAQAMCLGACGMMESVDSHQRYAMDAANHAILSKHAFKLQRKAADRKHDAAKEIAENLEQINHRWSNVRHYSRKLMNAEQEQFQRGAAFNMYEPPVSQVQYQQPSTGMRYYHENQWQEVRK